MENLITYIKDLEELQDISDSVVITEEPNIFENNEEEFLETCFELMDEYLEQNPHAISEPDFLECFQEEIEELFYSQWEEEILWVEEDLNELLEIAFEIYFSLFCPVRSLHKELKLEEFDDLVNNSKKQYLQDIIDYLKSKPQPVQRTDEWYKFRYNLITASNAYKAFESQAMMNQLIYEKCLPLKSLGTVEGTQINTMVNTNTTLHWGQKYEPLSVLFYEEMYKTKVDDFGCIQHDTYSFLGASPDGINVDQTSDRFGRMLEIKNIVNREITGIPKKEYWVQMQLQMEVCNLDECDFLETKFTEYPDETAFFQDSKELVSNVNLKQGIILHFHTTSSAPYYVYKPLNIVDQEKIEEWSESMVAKYESLEHNMLFIKHIYWKLEKLSCVLVTRNKKWFQDNVNQIENIWRIIEKERITGYQHRAPNKRPKTDHQQNTKITNFFQQEEGCLINLNKIKVTKLPSDFSDF
jgi:putative phage-type endonuclease